VLWLWPELEPTCCGASAAIACCDRLLCLPKRLKLGILTKNLLGNRQEALLMLWLGRLFLARRLS
jgi:hypothetical protein